MTKATIPNLCFRSSFKLLKIVYSVCVCVCVCVCVQREIRAPVKFSKRNTITLTTIYL